MSGDQESQAGSESGQLETGATAPPSTIDARGSQGVQVSGTFYGNIFTYETVAMVAAGTVYAKAFLETLGQRSGEGVANLAKQVGEVARVRMCKGRPDGYLVGIEEATAILIVTEDLPDEARLALLDFDVTADEVRGKLLRWDNEAMTWRPDVADD